MTPTARLTAIAQIILSIAYTVGYFLILYRFLDGEVHVAPVWRDQLGVLLGVLTAGQVSIIGFWFARNRAEASGANFPNVG